MSFRLLIRFAKTGTGKVRFVCQVTGIFLLIGVLSVRAENSGNFLSEQDAIRFGLERPEIIQRMQSRLSIAESRIVEARTWLNPEFSYDQETFDDGSKDIRESSYMLSQEFSISGQRSIQIEAAEHRRDATKWDVAQWRLKKTAEIRQKFYELLCRQQLMEIYAQIRSAMDDLETVMQERKKAGDISGYDLSRLQQERALLEADHTKALAEQQRLIQGFSASLGLADKKVLWTGVKGNLFPPEPSPLLDRLMAQAADQPDLMTMKMQIKAFAADERHAKRAWLPDLTLGLGYKDTDAAEGDAMLFGVSLPIPVLDRNKADKQMARANYQQLRSEYSLALAEKKGLIRGLWHQDKELAAAVKSLSGAESAALLDTAKVAYKAGEIGILEILDAHRSAFEHQVRLLDLMKAARMVRIDLELNTGGACNDN